MAAITILGCGLAGSWVAHHLVHSGWDDFVLFDGGDDRQELRSLGPIPEGMPSKRTAAEALATHLKSINPNIKVEIFGSFDLEADLGRIRGNVVGTMSSIDYCKISAIAIKDAGHQWVTLALPSTAAEPIIASTDPSALLTSHFAAPYSSRDEISEKAKAVVDLLR